MAHWEVVSGEYGEVVPILDDGTGPMEFGADYVAVEAPTKREAIKLAIKSPEFQNWVDMKRGDGQNPFSGVKAYNPVCKHGVCVCDMCKGECGECYREVEEDSKDD